MWYNCRFSIRWEIERTIMHNTEQVVINTEIGNKIRSVLVEIMLFSFLNIFPFYRYIFISIWCWLLMIESQGMKEFMDYCTCTETTLTQIQSLRTGPKSLLISNLWRASAVGLYTLIIKLITNCKVSEINIVQLDWQSNPRLFF